MQLPLTDRGHWPWWLAATIALALAALWWEPTPAPGVRLANRASEFDGGSPLATMPSQASTLNQAAAPKPTPAPAPAPTKAPPLQLVGTVMAGAGSMAMVRRTADAQLLELRVGDRVEGLAVTAIEAERVVLAGAGQPIVIEAARPVAGAAPPVTARAVGPPPAPAYAEGDAPWDLVPPFRH